MATYSFDMLACSLLIILAWRARPGQLARVGAAVALGLLAGFRQSIVQSFALLALIAVVASTRRLEPTGRHHRGRCRPRWPSGWCPCRSASPAASPPGGGPPASRPAGAAQATSVFDHGAPAATNLGTFAGYTVVALAPLAVLDRAGRMALAVRGRWLPTGEAGTQWSAGRDLAGLAPRAPGLPMGRPGTSSGPPSWPPPSFPRWPLVALVQFAKGGYLLAYLPAAVIALLLPLGAADPATAPGAGRVPVWLVVTSVGVVLVPAIGAQRFLAGNGVLPRLDGRRPRGCGSASRATRPRTPTPGRPSGRPTPSTPRCATLGPTSDADRDVVVFDTIDGGANIYRNAGWALPDDRVALVSPDASSTTSCRARSYYTSAPRRHHGGRGPVGLGAAGGLSLAARTGRPRRPTATPDRWPRPSPSADYRVWQVRPGVAVLGVPVVARPGPRPLGHGVSDALGQRRWLQAVRHRLDEGGIAVDDPWPPEPLVDIGPAPLPESLPPGPGHG